jgi:hypothetical protein
MIRHAFDLLQPNDIFFQQLKRGETNYWLVGIPSKSEVGEAVWNCIYWLVEKLSKGEVGEIVWECIYWQLVEIPFEGKVGGSVAVHLLVG